MNVATTIKKLGIEQALKYLYKEPEKNLAKLMDWADKFAKGGFETQRRMVRHAIENPDDAYYPYIRHLNMPVGNDAAPELLPNPKQRETVYRRVRQLRATKPLFAMDFQNDAEYVGGCIAGGRRYLHINANGDADPCVFIHYSNANIRECTLLEALQSPIFMAYHDNQPFNDNMLRPCPMLENPEFLRKMVAESGAHSTDPQSPETVDHLCAKCDAYAGCWKTQADRLWAENRAAKNAAAKNAEAKNAEDCRR